MSKEKKNGFLKLVILGVVLVGWLFKVDGEVWACSGEAECCNIVDQVWYCSGDHSELCSGSSDPYCANRGLGTCVRGPDSCFDSYTTGCILGWKNGVYGCNPQSCLPGQTHFSDTCSWGNVPDCNDSSAASCQGKDIGDACVNNGTCQDGNGDGACTCSGQDDPCTEGGWVDDACGWNNECETDQMRQTRSYTPAGCLPTEYQCIDDEVPACRPAVCVSSAIDTTVLVKDSSLVITVTGSPPESTINYFSLAFYNKDNLDGGNPKPIWFTGTTHYSRICYADGSSSGCTVSGNSATFTINYSELNYPDLNWGGGYPVNIQVNGYFGLADGGFSRADGNCVESFNMCAPTSPGVPVLTSPANGTETGLTVTLDWNGVGSWGEDCGAGVRNYLVYANQFIEATTRRTTTTATSFLFAPTDVGMWY
ncbi:hypothetical protein KJ953_00895, partial [Patescibacteria group bacterium]|nr:hypothetical protein [Patescibacteria group bacterium]